jgi:serine/threonine protein kinase
MEYLLQNCYFTSVSYTVINNQPNDSYSHIKPIQRYEEMGGGSSIIKNLTGKMGAEYMTSSPVDVESYKFGPIIGMGSFAIVRVATHKASGKMIAMKEMSLDRNDPPSHTLVDKFVTEIESLKRMGNGHPNVIKLQVAFHTDSLTCFMGLDYISGGDLRSHLMLGVVYSQHQVAYIIGSVGLALNFLHSHRILHRDVKPENIVLSALGVPVLTDFGEAHLEDSIVPLSKGSSGSWPYMAPEALTANHRHSVHADFWSLGIVMYELIFRHRPFMQHCSKSMIYFSENHYQVLWQRVEAVNTSQCDFDNDRFDVDWDALASCNEEMRLSALKHPNHDIVLPEDNSLSEELLVPIPCLTAEKLAVSDECKDFLSGLLDVRIPRRLGAGSKYSKFTNHAWLLSNDFDAFDSGQCKSPLDLQTDKIRSYIKTKFAEASFIKARRSMTPTAASGNSSVVLSRKIKEKLDCIEYVTPHAFDEDDPETTLSTCATVSLARHFLAATLNS